MRSESGRQSVDRVCDRPHTRVQSPRSSHPRHCHRQMVCRPSKSHREPTARTMFGKLTGMLRYAPSVSRELEEEVLMIRMTARPGAPIDPASLSTVDEIVQARIDRRITRRQLIERAGQLGVGAAVLGVLLRAANDTQAAAGGRGAATLLRNQDGSTVPVEGPTAPEGAQVAGGALLLGGHGEPDTLHPYLTQLQIGFDMFSAPREGLVALDENLAPQPRLATEYSISEDGLSYTFTLREGVKWHNGEDFVADDVINTW